MTTQEPDTEKLAQYLNKTANEIQTMANILGVIGLFVMGITLAYFIYLFVAAHAKIFIGMTAIGFGMCAVAVWEDYHGYNK